MKCIQFEEFATAQGYACILSSATLNMRWASLTFSLRVCYGPASLSCHLEQFLLATFSCTTENVVFLVTLENLHFGKWNTQAEMRIDLKLWVGGNYHLKPLSPATKDSNEMEMVRLWSPAGWLMTLISSIFYLVDRIMTSFFRANTLLIYSMESGRLLAAHPPRIRSLTVKSDFKAPQRCTAPSYCDVSIFSSQAEERLYMLVSWSGC